MNTVNVVMVRVYLMESSHLLNKLLTHLKKEVGIRGVSVFRAIDGFGEGQEHASALMDLSLDLPIVMEFFDDACKVEHAITYLQQFIKPEHMVFWNAKTNG